MNLLQKGNHKLPKSTGIFNLPRVITCPGQTSYCKKVCYAGKAERQYKNVREYRSKMLTLTKEPGFESQMLAEIHKSKLTVIRIHEAGDFYSQAYLDKWLEIARALTAVQFYCYTKSYMLDFSPRPLNFVARLSLDPTSNSQALAALPGFDGEAWTVPKKSIENPDVFTCPGSCKTCDYCLKPGDVQFLEH
jgi:hypothetical protein